MKHVCILKKGLFLQPVQIVPGSRLYLIVSSELMQNLLFICLFVNALLLKWASSSNLQMYTVSFDMVMFAISVSAVNVCCRKRNAEHAHKNITFIK